MISRWNDFNRALIEDMRAHGGKATSGPFVGRDVLILTNKGARSGEMRETPLVYSRDGDRYVIVASKGGAPTNPSWYHNLVAHAEVTVEVLGAKFKARAHVQQGDEYERLYTHHARINPAFNDYRQRTTRKIPVVVLERIGSSTTATTQGSHSGESAAT
jgi:deazaflavin-dependent oxidoreductase (nitroreductase family)